MTASCNQILILMPLHMNLNIHFSSCTSSGKFHRFLLSPSRLIYISPLNQNFSWLILRLKLWPPLIHFLQKQDHFKGSESAKYISMHYPQSTGDSILRSSLVWTFHQILFRFLSLSVEVMIKVFHWRLSGRASK